MNFHDEDHGTDSLSPAELQAAEWALRRMSPLCRRDEMEFQAWLAQDPAHHRLLDECEKTSTQLDRLRVPAAAASEYWTTPRRFLCIAAGLAVLLLVSAAGFRVAWPDPLHYKTTSTTAIGKFKRLNLPDGSVLTLNTDSAVEVAFDPAARRVRLLRGEAYFSVAHAPERPFRVDAAQVRVQAVGTAFNVRYHPKKIEVTVTEGRVALNDATGAVLTLAAATNQPVSAPSRPTGEIVAAGARATVALTATGAPAAGPVNVANVPAPAGDSALAWQAGRLEFSETPLADVVSEFNRYNRHQMVIEDPELATQRFGGAFACNGYTSFIEVLERSFNVVAERRGNYIVLRRR